MPTGKPTPISPLISDIGDSRDDASKISGATSAIRWVLAVVSALLLVASLLLVANTIRLSIYARRREVEVMRLVGATNWFIRWPFMVEGLVCGLVGAGIAIGFLFARQALIVDPLANNFNLISSGHTIAVRQSRARPAGRGDGCFRDGQRPDAASLPEDLSPRWALLMRGACLAIAVLVVGIVVGGQVGAIRDAVDDVFGNQSQDATAQAIDVIHDDYFHTVDDADSRTPRSARSSTTSRSATTTASPTTSPRPSTTASSRDRGLSGVGIAVTRSPAGCAWRPSTSDTPAREAGIQAGEVITAVNGESIAGKDADTVDQPDRGPAGHQGDLDRREPRRHEPRRDPHPARGGRPQVSGRIEDVERPKLGYVRLPGSSPAPTASSARRSRSSTRRAPRAWCSTCAATAAAC